MLALIAPAKVRFLYETANIACQNSLSRICHVSLAKVSGLHSFYMT